MRRECLRVYSSNEEAMAAFAEIDPERGPLLVSKLWGDNQRTYELWVDEESELGSDDGSVSNSGPEEEEK